MRRFTAALRREPVRLYVYGALWPALAVMGAYGLVNDEQALAWYALGGAVLSVGAVEKGARASVSPAPVVERRDLFKAMIGGYRVEDADPQTQATVKAWQVRRPRRTRTQKRDA